MRGMGNYAYDETNAKMQKEMGQTQDAIKQH